MPGAASLRHTLLLRNVFHLIKADSMSVWLQRKSSRVEIKSREIICPLDRCNEGGSSHRRISSLLLRLLSEFSLLRLEVRSTEPSSRVNRNYIHDYVETTVMLHYNHRRDNNVDVFELTAYNY